MFLSRCLARSSSRYTFVTQLERVLDGAEEIGLPCIGTASSPGARYKTVDGYRRAAEDFNRLGAAARERGMRFYLHNHSGEFAVENGTRLYGVILPETDARLVFFELDIFWAYAGQSRFPGFKPHEYPWSMPERFPLFHIKEGIDYNGDEVEGSGQFFGWDMTDVGDGDIAFEPFFCGLDTKPRHYLVERDTARDPVRNPAGSSPRPSGARRTSPACENGGGRSRSLGAPPSVTRVIRLTSIVIARDETQALDLPETAANLVVTPAAPHAGALVEAMRPSSESLGRAAAARI
jgi:sugar phosphate isomerase/epimerase